MLPSHCAANERIRGRPSGRGHSAVTERAMDGQIAVVNFPDLKCLLLLRARMRIRSE